MKESIHRGSGKPLCCSDSCFSLFVVISLFTHIAEVFLNSVYIYYVHTDTASPEWTATTLGFLLLPVVVTQLFSAILHLQWRATNSDVKEDKNCILIIALVHVLQLGFIWRHLRILNESNPVHRKKLLVDLLLLRLVFAFISGLPLLLLQTHYLITRDRYHGIQLATMIISLLSTAWALASFRRQNEFCDIGKVILTWPGIVFRLLWRTGEITARIISLAVFASVYRYWVFLVLGLHWLTMIISIWAAILGTVERKEFGRVSHVMICAAIGYVYTFTHLNFSNHRARCRYICYYSIIFLETCVLIAVWLLKTPSWRENSKTIYLMAAIGIAFVVGLLAMIVYYSFFHITLSRLPKGNIDVCIQDGCINCRLSLCAKHNKVLQRPFNTAWGNQYQMALYTGNYYKNVLQDSLLDSASELEDRFQGNTSFNDREVELIMKSEKQNAVSCNRKLCIASEPFNQISGHRHPSQISIVPSKSNTVQATGVTISATSTLKSSLDLYNNLNSIQIEKSYETSTTLKDKALRDTASVSSSLLKLDADSWSLHDCGITSTLSRYTLPVSCIGVRADCATHRLNGSSSRELHKELRSTVTLSQKCNNGQSDTDVTSHPCRHCTSTKEETVSGSIQVICVLCKDDSNLHSLGSSDHSSHPWYDCSEEGDVPLPSLHSAQFNDVSSYVYDTDSDGNPEMII